MDSEVFLQYLQYLKATRLRWNLLDYAGTKNDLCTAFSAIRESRLEKLHLYLNDEFMIDPECLIAMETALTLHPTLKMIKIGAVSWTYDPLSDCWTHILLESLASIKQLELIVIYDTTTLDLHAFLALQRVLQSNRQLKVLKIKYHLSSQQTSILLNELKELKRLETISLGALAQLDNAVLKSIGAFLAERPHIKYDFRRNYDYDAQDIIKSYLDPSATKPRKMITTDEPSISELSRVYLPNLEVPFIDLLPIDVVKLILFQLNFRPLLHFTMTNKRARDLCMRNEFWRTYYLQHFDNIPADILEVISLLHGETLLQAKSLQEVRPTWNIWLAALRHMPLLYLGPGPNAFPSNPTDLRGIIEKRYPQFIGSHLGAISDSDKDAVETVWFMKQLNHSIGYLKLGFHKNRSGVYSCIFLSGNFYQDHTSRAGVWEMIEHIFDWKTANSGEELMNKCKDMCEAFILSHYRHNWDDKYTLYFKTISPSASRTFPAFDSAQEQIRTVIETRVEQICERTSTQDYTRMSHIISNKLDRLSTIHSTSIGPDYLSKQKLKKRSELHRKYWRGTAEWMNFHTSNWDATNGGQQKKDKNEIIIESRRRPLKAIPKVLLMRLIRTTLNFIVMPVLIACWPQDLKHEDSDHYAHYIDNHFQSLYTARYSNNFTPVESLSISSASPRSWPIIAVGVAKLIIADICNAVEEWITREMTGSEHVTGSKVSDLIDALTRFNLFSPAHLNDVKELLT